MLSILPQRHWQRKLRGSLLLLTSQRSPGISSPSIPRGYLGQDFFAECSLAADVSPRVLQPSLGPAPTVDDINVSQREIYDTLSGAKTMISALQGGQGNWVHVAVAAEAHVRATRAVAAGGHRIIVRSGPFFYQDIRKFHILFLSCIR